MSASEVEADELPAISEPKPAKPKAPAKSVFQLLRERYPSPAWAFLEEVRNQTGFGRTIRTPDALPMSLYPAPLPPSHTSLGAILRKVCTTLTEQVLLDQAFARGEEKGYREGVNVEIKRSDDGRLKKAHDDLVASVRAFEEASGVSISAGWNRGKIAKAVGLLTGGWGSIGGFTEIPNQAARRAERCAEAAEEVKKPPPPIKDDP